MSDGTGFFVWKGLNLSVTDNHGLKNISMKNAIDVSILMNLLLEIHIV